MRPPWSGSEEEFTESCTLCGECISSCPAKVITTGHAGYPIMEFSGAGCNFCGACADVCKPGSIDRRARAKPWLLKAAISQACIEPKGVACRMCEEVCEVSAIRFRPRIGGGAVPSVGLVDCTGCGACVAPCPVQAISITAKDVVEATI